MLLEAGLCLVLDADKLEKTGNVVVDECWVSSTYTCSETNCRVIACLKGRRGMLRMYIRMIYAVTHGGGSPVWVGIRVRDR